MSEINFTPDVIALCEKIRLNSGVLHEYNRKLFLKYTERIRYYRIPVLLLSSVASVWSIAGTSFLPQSEVSLLNMLFGLIAGSITSLELFNKLDEKIRNAEELSHKFYTLSVEINKMIMLDDCNRSVDGKDFLNECFNSYVKLLENSFIMNDKVVDKLIELPKKMYVKAPQSPQHERQSLICTSTCKNAPNSESSDDYNNEMPSLRIPKVPHDDEMVNIDV
jgi:hypothetical protein